MRKGRVLTCLSTAGNPSFCWASRLGRWGWGIAKRGGLHRGQREGSRGTERKRERKLVKRVQGGRRSQSDG